jgi:hypothetical protein
MLSEIFDVKPTAQELRKHHEELAKALGENVYTLKRLSKATVENKQNELKDYAVRLNRRYVNAERYEIINDSKTKNVEVFLKRASSFINSKVLEKSLAMGGSKYSISLDIIFYKQIVNDEGEPDILEIEHHFSHQSMRGLNKREIKRNTQIQCSSLTNKFYAFLQMGSGWALNRIIRSTVSINRYNPAVAAKYIDLKPEIKNKKACINVKNNDEQCLKWALLSALDPAAKSSDRVSSYKPHEEKLKLDGIKFPASVEDIAKIEEMNNISCSVFTVDNDTQDFKLSTAYFTAERKATHIYLLFVTSKKQNLNHWVWIKDLSALLASSRSKDKSKMFFCAGCLHGFTKEDLLVEHEPKCRINAPVEAILPKKDGKANFIEFKNHSRNQFVPFSITADCEAITQIMEEAINMAIESKTKKYQHHKNASWGMVTTSITYPHLNKGMQIFKSQGEIRNGEFVEPVTYFVEELMSEVFRIMKILVDNVPMKLTKQQEFDFQNAVNCHICEKKLGDDRVRDHDHVTGAFRAAAHNSCNINFNWRYFKLPVIFHNLKGYDSHFLIKECAKHYKKRMDCVALTNEKYLSFSFDNIRFIDSFAFMSAGLGSLVEALAKTGTDKFTHTMNHFKDCTEEQKKLLFAKGIFPYDWFNDESKFNVTVLPDKEDFYSQLSGRHISDEEYDTACTVWNTFNMRRFEEYHDFYLKLDVLLLADVFENFRITSMKYYKLDPLYYLTAPGMAWDALLRKSGVRIELFNEDQYDMLLQTEQNIRGGISTMSTKKFAKSNNPYKKVFDKKSHKSYIVYLDANNLYGWAMSQPLPIGNYNWEDVCKFDTMKKIMKLDPFGKKGYQFKVDLDYPSELHDLHNDYPLAVENDVVTEDMLSEYSLGLKNQLGLKMCKEKCLLPTLRDKKEYVCHYRNLQLYLQLGLKLKKVHSVMSFDQSCWMKDYIDFNTNERAKPTCADFEKDFFKLMNNAVFGKTMENVRKRKDVRLVNPTKEKAYDKIVAKNNYEGFHVISDDLHALECGKISVVLDKCVIVGFSVLELSKLHMYNFHYNIMKKKYGNDIALLFTDTDSLCYEIKCDDVYKDMFAMKEHFDFSDYPKDSPFYDTSNKKVIGKFKDESHGIPIDEFCGLRSKMYSVKLDSAIKGKTEKKTAKGVKKGFVEDNITHDDYVRCLFGESVKDLQQTAQFNSIRSMNHELYSINVNKTSLCAYDTKRYCLNAFYTLAYGHYAIGKK